MNKKRLISLCAMLLALTLIFSAVPVFAENNAYVKHTNAGRINLRSGPSSQYRALASIEPGTPLEVLDVQRKWAHVLVANSDGTGKLEGYMYTDYVEYTTYNPAPSYPTEVVYDWQASGSQYTFPAITENTTMYVSTGNSGRLHLREYTSQNARSLGLFANGTKVTVLNRTSTWAFVYVNNMYGYMMLTYLSSTHYTPVQPTVPPYGAVTKYVNTGNSGRLHLREYASQNARSLGLFPNGTMVSAVDLGNGWSYVTVNGMVGYMMTCYLSATQPYIPSPSPYIIKYVYSPTGSRVVLRSAMSQAASSLGSFASGTPVYVLFTSGSWSYVDVGGLLGYMLNNSLSDTPYTPIIPGPPIGTATVVHPNGSFVYLRSSRSTDSLDNVLTQVPSGAQVTVYQHDEWYSLVQYNGITGYMVSHFLVFGYVPVPTAVPTPTAAPTMAPGTVYKMIVGGTPLRSSREESAGNIILNLPHGAIVEILLTYPDEWRYIEYNGINGYIHGPVVASVISGQPSPMMPVVPESPVLYTAVVKHPNGSYVNLRYSRSTEDNTNVLVQVPSGSVVEVMEQTGNWTKLRYNGVVGYMVSSYIEPLNQQTSSTIPSIPLTPAQPTTTSATPLMPATPIQQPQEPASGSENVVGKRRVEGAENGYVYLRSSKDSSTQANTLGRVSNGTIVELLESGKTWSKVRVFGLVGYIQTKYLKRV